MKKLIIKSNKWYDNLPEPKRTLFFLIVILGSLIVSECISVYVSNNIFWGFIIWNVVFCSWRISYVFIDWIDDYKKMHSK